MRIDDKTKRTVTPVSIVYWKQGVSIIRRKVLEGEKRALSANKGLRDALLRGPKTFVLYNRKPSYSVLWSALGVDRIEV